jgi:predicted metal-dependent hydrolase
VDDIPAKTSADVIARMEEGARLYNRGEYWKAHEAWEQAWHTLRGEEDPVLADLVQAFILATAAFENLSRGKQRGFATTGAKALHRLRAHRERAAELGVANAETFYEELLDVYLEVHRKKLVSLKALDRPAPRLVVEKR